MKKGIRKVRLSAKVKNTNVFKDEYNFINAESYPCISFLQNFDKISNSEKFLSLCRNEANSIMDCVYPYYVQLIISPSYLLDLIKVLDYMKGIQVIFLSDAKADGMHQIALLLFGPLKIYKNMILQASLDIITSNVVYKAIVRTMKRIINDAYANILIPEEDIYEKIESLSTFNMGLFIVNNDAGYIDDNKVDLIPKIKLDDGIYILSDTFKSEVMKDINRIYNIYDNKTLLRMNTLSILFCFNSIPSDMRKSIFKLIYTMSYDDYNSYSETPISEYFNTIISIPYIEWINNIQSMMSEDLNKENLSRFDKFLFKIYDYIRDTTSIYDLNCYTQTPWSDFFSTNYNSDFDPRIDEIVEDE